MDPDEAAERVGELSPDRTMPWLVAVFEDDDDGGRWLARGAWGLLPAGIGAEVLRSVCSTVSSGLQRVLETSPLTGLPGNRTVREALADRVLERGESAAYIDICSFKPFNDYYGFSRGDAVIRLLAQILSRRMPPGCLAAHIGGDDFVCIGPGGRLVPAVDSALEEFRGRSPGFYDESDRAAGGIETLDRSGTFRFFGFLDVSRVVVGRGDGSSPEELAESAGRAKKSLRGEARGSLSVDRELPEAREMLSRLAAGSRPEGSVRQAKALVEACGLSGDRETLSGLLGVLSGRASADVRKSAAYALGVSGAKEAVPALLEAFDDPSPHVRSRTVEAASRLGGPDLAPRLAKAAEQDPSTWVRRQALRGIGAAGCPDMWPRLLEAAERDHPGGRGRDLVEERGAALEGLAMLAPRGAAGRLAELALDEAYRPRDRAWQALFACGGGPAASAMLEALERYGPDGPESGIPFRWLRLLRPQGLSDDARGALVCALARGVHRGARWNRQRLQAMAAMEVSPGADAEDRLLGCLAWAEGVELELLLQVLLSCGIRPDPRHALEVVGRVRSRRLVPGRAAAVSFLRWVGRSPDIDPGILLEDFLRSPRREVRVAASRAVLGILRLRDR
jgi:HEAT repeat protein